MALETPDPVLVCDRAGRHQGEVETFHIERAGTRWEVDLCETHNHPLMEMAAHGRIVAEPRTRRTFRVTEPDELRGPTYGDLAAGQKRVTPSTSPMR